MSGNAERFEKMMNQGHNAAWDQMWDRAAQFYRQALDEIPDQPKALTSLALALYETQDYAEALVYYQRAAQIIPDDPIPLEKVAELLEKTGKTPQAIDAFMKSAEVYLKNKDVNKGIDLWLHVVGIKPDHLMARSRLALVYERLGRKPDAIREYLAVASLLQNAGEVQKSIQAVTRALQIQPDNADAQQAMASIKAGRLLPKPATTRQPSAAQKMAEAAREIKVNAAALPEPQKQEASPDPIIEAQQRALSELAALMFEQDEVESSTRRGMSDIVRGAFEAISGQMDRTKIMLLLSQVIDYQSRKQDRQAAEELERAVEAGLDHPAAYYNLGCLQIQTNQFQPGIENLQRVTSNPGYALGANLLLGQAEVRLGKYQEAAVDLLEALKQADMQVVGPENAAMLGQMYDPLIETYAERKKSPMDAPVQLCESILDMLVRPAWREYLRDARNQLPDSDADSITPLAEMLTAAGSNEIVEAQTNIQRLFRNAKYVAAMEEAYYALKYSSTYLPLHVLMGDILLQQGQFASAVDKYRTVARTYEIRGESPRAISLYRKIADLSPMDMQARSNLIDLMVASGQIVQAIEEFMRLADIYYNLADLVNTRAALNDAYKLAQQVNASKALKVKVLTRLADIETQSLDWRQARKTYEMIRNLQPEDETTRLSLIDLDFRLGQDKAAIDEIHSYTSFLTERRQVEKAAKFLSSMVDQNPKNPEILRQMAEFYSQVGQKDKAIQTLDAVGELYIERGERNSAVEAIMAILALNPPNAAQYQQLLAQLRGN